MNHSHDNMRLVQTPSTGEVNDKIVTNRSIFKSDRILRFFIYCLYGIVPCCRRSEHGGRFILPAILALGQWYAVAEYSYVIGKFWKNETYQKPWTNKTCFTKLSGNMLKIPTESAILLMGLVISGALTVTLGAFYFRRNLNRIPIRGRRQSELFPRVNVNWQDEHEDLSSKDWLQTNVLLAAGIFILTFAIFTDQFYNTYFDFVGIHNFLRNKSVTPGAEIMYYSALGMLFWGYGATICACCLFHAMALRIKTRVEDTESMVLKTVQSRESFFTYTNYLIRFKREMIKKFKIWFVSHNVMFIMLLAAIIYEWIKVFQNGSSVPKECLTNLIMSQLSGTLIILYKFAFPIMSASLVTHRFNNYFENIAYSNKIKDMDVTEILALAEHSGFEVFSVRITPKLALLIFASCFIGIVKVLAQV